MQQTGTIYQSYKYIVISIIKFFPAIDSIWGMVFYAVFSYLITFCIVGGVNYWVNKNVDLDKMVKQRVLQERRKLQERQKKAQQVIKETHQRFQQMKHQQKKQE